MNNSRLLIILLLVTVVAVVAAAVVVLQEQASVTRTVEPATLFPDIAPRLESVAELDVRSADGGAVVRRTDSGWVVPAKHNYPADRVLVREVVLAFSQMEAAEAKTTKPELYDRLGLRDIDRDGSTAALLTLRDAAGQTVAALLIGDRAPARGVYGRDSARAANRAYVRILGEAQSWLALGVPEVSSDPGKWIDDGLLTLPRERIKRITVNHSDGAQVKLSRASAQIETFTVADVPKGRRVKTAMGPDSAAAALAFLSFDDVKPAADMDWSGATVAVFTAFDGLEITARVNDGWANFKAAYRMQVAEEGEGAEALPASPPDGEAEAGRLNARYGAWAYKLPDYKVHDMTPTLEDLTEPVKKDEAP